MVGPRMPPLPERHGATTVSFGIARGLQGINHLALALKAASFSGDWHFAQRSQVACARIDIDFDVPQDAERAARDLIRAGLEKDV